MLKAKIITLLFFLALCAKGVAHTPAEGKIYASFGPYFYRTLVRPPVQEAYSPYLTGFGLLAEGDLDDNGGIEIDMFYMEKFYLRKEADNFNVAKIKRMHINTGYRHWFNSSFSSGAAFFSSYSMGDARKVHGGSVETSAPNTVEYGIDFSGQWEFWSHGDVAAILDGRYSWSLTKKLHEHADVYGIGVYLSYLLPKSKLGPNRD